MGRKKTRRKPLGTIWEVPEGLWRRIEPLLKEFWPRKATGLSSVVPSAPTPISPAMKKLSGDYLLFCPECSAACAPLPRSTISTKKSFLQRVGDTLRLPRRK